MVFNTEKATRILLIIAVIMCEPVLSNWNQGCYRHSYEAYVHGKYSESRENNQPLYQAGQLMNQLPLIACGKRCRLTGFELVAVREGICLCLNDTNTWVKVRDVLCNALCPDIDVELHCGGLTLGPLRPWSVYRSAGPYLVSASTLITSNTVTTGVPYTLWATGQLADIGNCSSDKSASDDVREDTFGWARSLLFQWDVDGVIMESKTEACSPFIDAFIPVVFNHTKNIFIDLKISNALSTIRTTLTVKVSLPKPRGLQVLPGSLSIFHTPSCINDFNVFAKEAMKYVGPMSNVSHKDGRWRHSIAPLTYDGDDFATGNILENENHLKYNQSRDNAAQRRMLHRHGKSWHEYNFHNDWTTGVSSNSSTMDHEEPAALMTVFADQSWDLVVGLEAGINVTFDITITNSNGTEVIVSDSIVVSASCISTECLEVTQIFVLHNPGIYTAHVTASNLYGRETNAISVVVVSREMRGTMFSMWGDKQSIHLVSSTVTFDLSLVNTDRNNSYVYVHFGDNAIGFSPLRERRLSVSDGNIENFQPPLEHILSIQNDCVINHVGNLTGLHLTTNYGDNCKMQIKFDHVYTSEGTYFPTVFVSNRITNGTVNVSLSVPVVVANKLLKAHIEAPSMVAVGIPVSIGINILPKTSNFTVRWTISNKLDANVLTVTTGKSDISAMLHEAIIHRVSANVSNIMGMIYATKLIHVQRKIKNLQIDCYPRRLEIAIDEKLECNATIDAASKALFIWDFGDGVSKTEMERFTTSPSTVSYTYNEPGEYNVTVTAHNNVDSVTATLGQSVKVGTLVRCLHVDVVVNQQSREHTITVTALGGTNVQFMYDVGDGMRDYDGLVEHNPANTTAVLTHAFSYPGMHYVNTTARNAHSVSVFCTQVQVQAKIGKLTFEQQASTAGLIVVMRKGKPLDQKGLIYHVSNTNGADIITASPFIVIDGTNSSNHFIVNLTISSEVDIFWEQLSVELNNISAHQRSSRLKHKAIVFIHHDALFTVQEPPIGAEIIKAQFSDTTEIEVVNVTTDTEWRHKFLTDGIKEVAVTVYGGRQKGTMKRFSELKSHLLVQSPITDLRITGPKLVQVGCTNVFEGSMKSGSYLVCRWSLDAKWKSTFTKHLQYLLSFSTDGCYQLRLLCHNDIGSSATSINITVRYPISSVRLSAPVSARLQPVPLNIIVSYGHLFYVSSDFGDGTKTTIPSENLQLIPVQVNNNRWKENFPVFSMVVEHVYDKIGTYVVKVQIFNEISSVNGSMQVTVEEAIGSVVVSSTIANVINLDDNEESVFIAVVSTGKYLQFHWDFGDDDIDDEAFNESNSSVAAHNYRVAGQYTVTVKVYNHLQKRPIIGRLTRMVIAQYPVKGLSLELTNYIVTTQGTFGAHFHHLENKSEPLTFLAKSDGEPVTFDFDFGDGQFVQKEGISDLFYILAASATHRYSSEGVYTVKVTAFNLLNNITESLEHPIYVQVPVLGSLFDHRARVCTLFGDASHFTAVPIQGSNISFNWRLDDQTEFVNIGSQVSHVYRLPGRKTVEVTASNQVSQYTDHVIVNVVGKIQSVNLSFHKPVPAGEVVNYTATVFPRCAREHVDYFSWIFTQPPIITRGNNPTLQYVHRRSGSHFVTVIAHNCHGNATAVPMRVHVIARLAGLRLEALGDNLVNESIEFIAFTYQGDGLQFHWTFGDRSKRLTTQDTLVNHTYSRTGEFNVTLRAENPLGTDSVTYRLFILARMCKPPSVAFVGTARDEGNVFRVFRWQPLYMETDVTLNCSVANSVQFHWRVHRVTEIGTAYKMVTDVDIDLLHAQKEDVNIDLSLTQLPTLRLPPRFLSLGLYVVSLKVSVFGTEIPVYRKIQAFVLMQQSPLRCVIRGGILRQISVHRNFILDGSFSSDPDNSSAILKYVWKCQPLHHPEELCFLRSIDEKQSGLTHSVPQLRLNTDWLTNHNDFLFSLNVFLHTATTVRSARSSQVVQVLPDYNVVQVGVECTKCKDNWVNSGDTVRFEARSLLPNPVWSESRVQYQWNVSIVEGEQPEDLDISSSVQDACVNADGSSYRYLKQPTIKTVAIQEPDKRFGQRTTTHKRLHETTPSSKVVDITAATSVHLLPEKMHIPPWGVKEDVGTSRRIVPVHRGELSRILGRNIDTSGSLQQEASDSPQNSMGDLTLDIKEGTPERASQGRNLGNSYPNPVEEKVASRHMPSEVPACNGDEVDCRTFERPRPLQPHLTMRKHWPLFLRPEQVDSDVKGPSLVLKPGTLTQGLTYLVQVSASVPGTDHRGTAVTWVKVNKSPRKGACSVLPTSGVELETMFNLFCKEWQDEHLPLWYEAGYSLKLRSDKETDFYSASLDSHVIYRGFNHHVTFRLPAGLLKHGRQVFLRLNVGDSWGAYTAVCRISVVVKPQHPGLFQLASSSSTAAVDDWRNVSGVLGELQRQHRILQNDIVNFHQQLEASCYYGDLTGVRDAHEYLYSLAFRYGRLERTITTYNEHHDHFNRGAVRYQLLSLLRLFQVRDKAEIIKAFICLLVALTEPNQVDGEAFAMGTRVLEWLCDRTEVQLGDWQPLGTAHLQKVLVLSFEVASKLMQAVTSGVLLVGRHLGGGEQNQVHDRLRFAWCQRVLDALHLMASLALQDYVVGEHSVDLQSTFMTMRISHHSTVNIPSSWINISIVNATFYLPVRRLPWMPLLMSVDINKTIGQNVEGKRNTMDLLCFQIHAFAFTINPFVGHDVSPIQMQSGVVGIDVFDMDGKQVVSAEKLEIGNYVQFEVPTTPIIAEQSYLLRRSHMNIHHFNISRSHIEQTLLLLFNFQPINSAQTTFPITALISHTWPPSMENCLYRRDLLVKENLLRIYLKVASLNGTGTYHLALVDKLLNSYRRPSSEVLERWYYLHAWLASCLFWNNTEAFWSSAGCHVTRRTTHLVTHCRCENMASFGVRGEPLPFDTSIVNVDVFFELSSNPMVFILLVGIVVLFAVLLFFAHHGDCRDSVKGDLVCLQDNNITDTQLYKVIVETGLEQRMPTTAKISLILHGELGISETRELIRDDGHALFERCSRDRFLLTLPESLGRLVKLHLWHDNAGLSPRWYLGQVTVRDLNTGKANFFLCENWFAVDEGDGKIERELFPLNEKMSFAQVFSIMLRQSLTDFHTWGSLILRPIQSHFTRTQRVTCCLVLTLSHLALNAVWHQLQPDQLRGEFGLLDVSWRHVVVGAICCAVVFPFHVLLCFMFRYSQVRQSTYKYKAADICGMSSVTSSDTSMSVYLGNDNQLEDDTFRARDRSHSDVQPLYSPTAIRTNTELSPAHTMATYSLLDQSILNWQSIQEWAQRQWVKRQQAVSSTVFKCSAPSSVTPDFTQLLQPTLLAEERSTGHMRSIVSEDSISRTMFQPFHDKVVSENGSVIKKSSPGHNDSEDQHSICLPFWCCHFAWMLAISVCIFTAVLTVHYAYRFRPVKNILFLQTVFFTFAVCAFCVHPIWMVLTAVWTAASNRNSSTVFSDYCERQEVTDGIHAWYLNQRHAIDNLSDDEMLEMGVRARQRSRYLRFSRPPQRTLLRESRKKLMREKLAVKFVRDTAVFVVMLGIVIVMSCGKDISSCYTLKHSLEMTLHGNGQQAFNNIRTLNDWHRWAQQILLPTLYGTDMSSGLFRKNGVAQGNNILIGALIMKQWKHQHQPDVISSFQSSSEDGCRNVSVGDRKDLLSSVLCSGTKREKTFDDAKQLTLSMDGSSMDIGRQQLQSMEKLRWLEQDTGVIAVELSVLNAPTSLFSSVVLQSEVVAAKRVIPTSWISSTYVFRYVTSWDKFVLLCEVFFILLTLVNIENEIATLLTERWKYFLQPLNYTRTSLCLMSISYIVCYFYRYFVVVEVVEFLRSTFYTKFISLQTIAMLDEILRCLAGLILFSVIISHGLKLLYYCPRLAKFTLIYKHAWREINVMGVIFFILTVASSNLGTILFGNVLKSMSNVWSATACIAVAMVARVKKQCDTLAMTNRPGFSVFLLCCYFWGFGLLVAYAVAILTRRFHASKRTRSLAFGKCNFFQLCFQQLTSFIGLYTNMPSHEPQFDLPPECTLAEFEYQVDELLFRMNSLSGTSNLPEKQDEFLSDSGQSQTLHEDRVSSLVGPEDVAKVEEFDERLEQHVQKIEDKLYTHEPDLGQLLKLDSTATEVMTAEKEKRIRSHLEMETFRQLQMK